ncbi:hypothetical protein, partial [Klebsiella pneumoniae]|uniref:hypothetical protein n=1 Tax=Klebsiella pneumoniae TaxID=573 RepID=UPI001CA46A07
GWGGGGVTKIIVCETSFVSTMLTQQSGGSTLDVSTMMIREVMSVWPYVSHHVWDYFHSDECGFFGWACFTRP